MLKKLTDLYEDPKLSEQRLEICRKCDFFENNLKIFRCSKCGCLLQIKTLFKSQSCPINKW